MPCFVTEIDDEHKEIFEAVSDLQRALSEQRPTPEVQEAVQRLVRRTGDHFAHEERLMRAARYSSMRWHKTQHDGARRRVEQFVSRIEAGELEAGTALVEHLSSWLRDHTRLADRMMGAFLRNQRRIGKVTIQTGTKPLGAGDWVDSNGDPFDPRASVGCT
ncbi:MAG: hemerythrin family protein [Ignavibacteriota bacterium]